MILIITNNIIEENEKKKTMKYVHVQRVGSKRVPKHFFFFFFSTREEEEEKTKNELATTGPRSNGRKKLSECRVDW